MRRLLPFQNTDPSGQQQQQQQQRIAPSSQKVLWTRSCSGRKLFLILGVGAALLLLMASQSTTVRRLRRSSSTMSAFGIPQAPNQEDLEQQLAALQDVTPTIPVYYINLEKSKDRREQLEQRLDELQGTGAVHLKPQRFPAIEPGMSGEVEFAAKFPTTAKLLLPTERACYASHAAVLRRIANDASLEEDAFVLVLEDDAVYREGTASHIAAILATVVKTAPPFIGFVQLSSIGAQRNLAVRGSAISEGAEEYLDALSPLLNEPLDQSLAGAAVAFLIRKAAARDFLQGREYGAYVFDTDLRDNAFNAAREQRWTAFRFVRSSGLGRMSGVVVNNMAQFASNINAKPMSKELKRQREEVFAHKG